MMRALWAGVSGLKNHQTRMDVIGNNIANVNTVGFKASRVTFQDMLSQTIQGAGAPAGNVGGTNAMQVGMGMALASVDTIFSDGAPQATGKQTDLAISGQGFFQVSKDGGVTKEYTRDGAFDFDSKGNYVIPNTGYKVMGYTIDDTGVATGNLNPIVVSKTDLMPGKVSTSLSFINNLSDSSKAIANVSTALNNIVDTTPASTVAGTLVFDATKANATAVAIGLTPAAPAIGLKQATLDATAAAKQAAIDAKTATAAALANVASPAATPTQAEFNLTAVNAVKKAVETATLAVTAVAADPGSTTALTTDVAAAKATASAALALVDTSSDIPTSFDVYATSGTPYTLKGTFEKITANQWAFTPSGQITDATGALIGTVSTGMAVPATVPPTPVIKPIIINFSASGAFAGSTTSTITVTPVTPPAPAAGPAPFNITPDFKTMTQYNSKSTAMANSTDGYSAGSLDKLTISPAGMFTGVYTNGVSKNLAQVALFTFNNPGGLAKNGGNLYAESNNSGNATKDQSSSVNPGNLEMSNVDLAQQFSDMIVTQRGFQANSKIITTGDTMLEELVNLKR